MSDPIDDPTLGRLTWDKDYKWWTGQVELRPQKRIGLTVEADPAAADPAGVLAKARAWVERVREREAEYVRWTAERLVGPRWNKEREMTAADIAGLIEVAAVECFPDGTAHLIWEDAEVLFFGHGIVTHLDAAGGCVRIEIQ